MEVNSKRECGVMLKKRDITQDRQTIPKFGSYILAHAKLSGEDDGIIGHLKFFNLK